MTSKREGPRRRMPRWARVALWAGLALVLLAGSAALGVRALVARYDRTVTRDTLLDPTARHGFGDRQRQLAGALNYLIIGSDLRVSNPSGGQRSDTIVIAHVPRTHDRAYLISVPRDLLVDIPPYAPTGYAGGPDKINAAFQFGHAGAGGAQLLSATLTQLTGVRFNGAAIIDFGGFKGIVDAIGGISICVDHEVRSIHTRRLFKVGCQRMNGTEALDYARQRYDLPEDDWDRQRHHQQLLKAIMSRVADAGMLTNPLKLDRLARAVGSAMTLDANGIPLDELVFALRKIRPDGLVGVQTPGYDEVIDGTAYVLLDAPAKGLFAALRNDGVQEWAAANPRWVNTL